MEATVGHSDGKGHKDSRRDGKQPCRHARRRLHRELRAALPALHPGAIAFLPGKKNLILPQIGEQWR